MLTVLTQASLPENYSIVCRTFWKAGLFVEVAWVSYVVGTSYNPGFLNDPFYIANPNYSIWYRALAYWEGEYFIRVGRFDPALPDGEITYSAWNHFFYGIGTNGYFLVYKGSNTLEYFTNGATSTTSHTIYYTELPYRDKYMLRCHNMNASGIGTWEGFTALQVQNESLP